MLLEFKCTNHKSIGSEIKFSMLASSDDTNKDRLIEYDNNLILPSAVIYGANGSGKSNLIGALQLMRDIVTGSILIQPGDSVPQLPHKLLGSTVPSTFSIQFVRKDIRYAYGFSTINGEISEEYLFYFPNGKQVNVFTRNKMEVVLGSRFKKGFETSLNVLKENRLFLSCAANFSASIPLNDAFMFFKEDIVFPDTSYNCTEFTANMLRRSDILKVLIIRMLGLLGTGIRDIKIREKDTGIPQVDDSAALNMYSPVYSTKNQSGTEIEFIYDRFSVSYDEESIGIKKVFQMTGLIIDALIKNKVLICDEIETSLHESLMPVILSLFYCDQCPGSSQLIFTTHDTGLLNSNLFRRDQIWFTQLRNEDRTTDLYSLGDIHNVRKSENYEKGYVSGRYGAVPMLNEKFIEEFCAEIHEESHDR